MEGGQEREQDIVQPFTAQVEHCSRTARDCAATRLLFFSRPLEEGIKVSKLQASDWIQIKKLE